MQPTAIRVHIPNALLNAAILAGMMTGLGSTVRANGEPVALPRSGESFFSKIPIKFCGYIRGEFAYSTSDMGGSPQNSVRLVNSGGSHDGHFGISARDSRFGYLFTGPEGEGIKSSARLEVDFFNDGGGESASAPRMRHAYVNIDWEPHNLSLLLGQTFDLIAPNLPQILNRSSLYSTGNLGFRSNQIRLTKNINGEHGKSYVLALAAVRSGEDGQVDSEDLGRPGWQARLATSFPGLRDLNTTVGLSGLLAKEDASAGQTAIWMKPPSSWICLYPYPNTRHSSRRFSGAATSIRTVVSPAKAQMPAAILSRLRPVDTGPSRISARSARPSISATESRISKSTDVTTFTSGTPSAANASRNSALFANMHFKLNSATTIVGEVQYRATAYKGAERADGLRFQGGVSFAL